ncbi:hypothetical protein YC2023_011878 [Brassica napus]
MRLIRFTCGGINFTRKLNRCYKKTEASGLGAICVYSAEHREAYLNKAGSLKLEVEFEVVSTTKYTPSVPHDHKLYPLEKINIQFHTSTMNPKYISLKRFLDIFRLIKVLYFKSHK